MPWLIREGEVLATLEVADSFAARLRGLSGRNQFDGAMLFPKTRSIHTFGMCFSIDVAFCDANLQVIEILTLPPNRPSLPRWRARFVLEAEKGAFDRWSLKNGDALEIKG